MKRLQEWLGHATASFTLETNIHLTDEGIGNAAFMDRAVGNGWATQHPEAAANGSGAVLTQLAD